MEDSTRIALRILHSVRQRQGKWTIVRDAGLRVRRNVRYPTYRFLDRNTGCHPARPEIAHQVASHFIPCAPNEPDVGCC